MNTSTVYICAPLLTVMFAGVIVSLSPGTAFGQATFQGLGDLPGGHFGSRPTAISADGTVVVGHSESASSTPRHEAFRWTQGSGMVGLGDLLGGSFESDAMDTSADGSVVVGVGQSASGKEAFSWTSTGGMWGLGDLPGGGFLSAANAASADGLVVVGSANSESGPEAFRWTILGGMVGLGDLPNVQFGSSATGTSADGSVIVGRSAFAFDGEAIRWTAAGGWVGLGDLPGGINDSSAFDVSVDGLVVVGYSTSALGREAFRWTQEDGMVGLGDLPGGVFGSIALATSADGSVIVGQGFAAPGGFTTSGGQAFYWTASRGMRSVQDMLVNHFGLQLDLRGWQLRKTIDVSADGLTIVGEGINPFGFEEAWIATLLPPSCGDGFIDGAEECDDGDTNNGDGCSSTCVVEPGSHCSGEPSVCIGIPTVSHWGLLVMGLLVLVAGTIAAGRGRTVLT